MVKHVVRAWVLSEALLSTAHGQAYQILKGPYKTDDELDDAETVEGAGLHGMSAVRVVLPESREEKADVERLRAAAAAVRYSFVVAALP